MDLERHLDTPPNTDRLEVRLQPSRRSVCLPGNLFWDVGAVRGDAETAQEV